MSGRKVQQGASSLGSVGAVVLAAGGSSRMGRPKAFLTFQGKTLLQVHLEAFAARDLELVVVGGAEWERLLPICRPMGAKVVRNLNWASTHPIDSLRLALQGVEWSACLVTPVDCPPVSSSDLQALLDAPSPSVLSHDHLPGHPVCLGRREIERLCGSDSRVEHLRSLLNEAVLVSSERAEVLLNFNRPADWKKWVGGDVSSG